MTEGATVVCTVCSDTHRVYVDGKGYRLCTSCPLPCTKCMGEMRRAYCKTTPCACACHQKGPKP